MSDDPITAMLMSNDPMKGHSDFPGRAGVPPAVAGILPGTSGDPHREAALASPVNPATAENLYSKRRRLPHFDKPWAIYYVTTGTCGRRILSPGPGARSAVLDALCHFNGRRYELFAACVMPDHTHVLFQPWFKNQPGDGKGVFWSLGELMHSLKSFTAKEINRLEGTQGKVWEQERYDRYVRGDHDLQKKFKYIVEHPWRAKLVTPTEEHPWVWTPDIEGERPEPDVPGKMPSTAGGTPALPGN